MAGLWDAWDKGDSPLESFTILTTEPNELVSKAHQRMPVILAPEDFDTWLDPTIEDADRLLPLLGAYPVGDMEGFPVDTFVNSPANDSPRCIEPLPI